VSQPYLALMERGQRPVPTRLLSKIAKLYRPGPTALPLESDFCGCARVRCAGGSSGQPRLSASVARRLARKRGDEAAEGRLDQMEAALNRARLAREDTLCQEGLSDAERCWLRQHRSENARHWNLLTDLDSESLPEEGDEKLSSQAEACAT
jgi:hypothetical protein